MNEEPPDEDKIDDAPFLCLVGLLSVMLAAAVIGAIIKYLCR